MKKIASLLFAIALLFTTTTALADNTWNVNVGQYLSDGGNDYGSVAGPYGGPAYLIATGNHGYRCIPSYLMGVTTFGATWGTVSNSDTQGCDSDFTINFYSGTGAAAAVGATIFTINFGQVWGSASQAVPDGGTVPMFGGVCYFLGPYATTGPTLSSFPLVQASASTATVVNTTGFTPASTTNFHFGCHVYNLGSPF